MSNIQIRVYDSPLDIPYVKRLILTLSLLGSWPHEVMGHKKWFYYLKHPYMLFVIWVTAIYLVTSYAVKNFGEISFLLQGRLYISVLMCAVCVQRLTMTWTDMYKSTTKEFFSKIHLFYHKDKTDYAMKTYIKVEKISNFFCTLLHLQTYCGVILYCLTPLVNSYQRGMFNAIKPANATYDHAAFYDLPFDYTTQFNGFIVVYLITLTFSFDVSASIIIFDLYIFIIIFHLWGHIKILKYNLYNFPKPQMKCPFNSISHPPRYNEEESRNITSLLVESIEHYKLIKKFMNEVSTAWGLTIWVYLFFHQISGCIFLVELSEMTVEALATFGILTTTLIQQLIQMSVVFELLGTQSETIKDAVYGVPWEYMNTKNRKIVLIYLSNVQEPLHLKALSILPVGVQTMASIMKTSISYFMLLRASTKDK